MGGNYHIAGTIEQLSNFPSCGVGAVHLRIAPEIVVDQDRALITIVVKSAAVTMAGVTAAHTLIINKGNINKDRLKGIRMCAPIPEIPHVNIYGAAVPIVIIAS